MCTNYSSYFPTVPYQDKPEPKPCHFAQEIIVKFLKGNFHEDFIKALVKRIQFRYNKRISIERQSLFGFYRDFYKQPVGKEKGTMMKKRNILILLWIAAACILCCCCGKKSGTILIGDTENRTEESVSQESRASGTKAEASGSADGTKVEDTEEENTVIRIYVCGAVVNPGVVEIASGSRVEDALLAAGGFTGEAAREAVNLADWVSDGQKLYFPAEGEEFAPDTGGAASGAEASSGLVNINTADAAALCTLPGVGESRAADIIAYREANGGFDSCEDIMKVPGIKDAMYEKIRDRISVK